MVNSQALVHESEGMGVTAPLLSVRGLGKQYWVGKQPLQAFSEVNFDIHRGQCVALVGESGCGKSSVAMSVLHLIEPDQGTVIFDGMDLAKVDRKSMKSLRQRFSIVFQNPYSSLNPRLNVFQLIEEPLKTHFRLSKAERRERVLAVMADVGLDALMLLRMPHELSGGQRQRVGIARALILDPDLLVLDEPTAALDVSVQATVVNLLNRLRLQRNLSYLFITHNLGLVERIADHVLVMYLGQMIESGPVGQVFGQPKHHYTRALLDSIPSLDPAKRDSLQPLQGEIPSPMNKPAGCLFHTRCPNGNELCQQKQPVIDARNDEPGDDEHEQSQHRVACHFPIGELMK
ncbi:ABC transporter ATP-binding protein [Photobacterium sp. TLY01]|uniref:ABC transporter ATP-binding protein n=1 Tax=Photobacterium sp. TLY01 TaxID=2907534 RepID=UPI001F183643|nr:oligopeptide/dipeptide ABC transporter ATP-binding protein [Photobacterium sp. TLY01]UIP26735.1 ATP-binding cassette domain-containing protein [Photobacterium sp. TLY01]